jgi:hypothetical protein
MGFAQDSMHSYVERDLKKKFPETEGWQIERDPSWDAVAFDYQVWRRRFGTTQRYLVDVCIDTKVPAETIRDLEGRLSAIAEQGVVVTHPILFVPTNADISAVPETIEVMHLKVLKVEEGDIFWWRKKALHHPEH